MAVRPNRHGHCVTGPDTPTPITALNNTIQPKLLYLVRNVLENYISKKFRIDIVMSTFMLTKNNDYSLYSNQILECFNLLFLLLYFSKD